MLPAEALHSSVSSVMWSRILRSLCSAIRRSSAGPARFMLPRRAQSDRNRSSSSGCANSAARDTPEPTCATAAAGMARKVAQRVVTVKPISQAVEEAIRAERRRLFWASYQQAAAAITENQVAAGEEAADRELFEGTLADALDAEPVPE